MRGDALPPALLCAALGLAMAYVPRRAWAPCLAMLVATATLFTFIPVTSEWANDVYLGCWVSVVLNAAMIHLPRRLSTAAGLALVLNSGIWAGTVVALTAPRFSILLPLSCVLVAAPAAMLVSANRGIAVKVVSSWLIAVALLVVTLQFLPVTPGYMPDHME